MSIECKFCDTVVNDDFSVGDEVIWTDSDGVEHEAIMCGGPLCDSCQDKFGDIDP